MRDTSLRRVAFLAAAALPLLVSMERGRALKAGAAGPLGFPVLALLAPGEKAVAAVSGGLRAAEDSLTSSHRLAQENRKLRAQLSASQSDVLRLQELEVEDRQLRRLLNYPAPPTARIVARVIGATHNAFARTVIVDRGRWQGVRLHDVAVTPSGLVGQVDTAPGPSTAVVRLLEDPDSGVGVLIQRSRTLAVAQGQGNGLLQLPFLNSSANVRAGDGVLTSGRGGIFPKGIVVGRVLRVRPDGTGSGSVADVSPTVDPDKLEDVLLLHAKGPLVAGAPS